jgi:hypothetical protein
MLDNPKKLQHFLDERLILKEPFSGGVVIVDRSMKVIAETPSGFGRIGISYADRDYLHKVFETANPRVSGPVVGKKPNTPAFGIAVAITDKDNKVIGALVGITYLDKPNFLDHITQNRYGASGYYILVDPKSRMIVTGSDKNRVMQKLPPVGKNWLIDRHASGNEETGITVNPLGVEVLASSKNIKSAGWYVVAALPTKEALLEGLMKKAAFAFDCIYRDTPFLKMADKFVVKRKDGIDMLLWQAFYAFEIFNGNKFDKKLFEVMKASV